jgi:predicted nucleic acid-binding protein
VKEPTATLVVDTAIIIASVLRGSDAVFRRLPASTKLCTTVRAIEEAERRIVLGMKMPALLPLLYALTVRIDIIAMADFARDATNAEFALANTVQSRNGSTRDAHILALARTLDSDIWSTDRDFAGTGVASWSTPNLLRALTEVEARP